MFNLFRSRDRAVRYLLGAFLLLVALSMLSYLIPNYDTGASAQDNIIAEVGDEKISLMEVQQAVQNVTRGRSIPPALMYSFVPQIVDQIINERALAFEAQRMGFRVSDADIANAIRTTIPSLFPEGRFLGKDAYASMLAQQNLTIPQFEESVSRQLLASRLRGVALEGTLVTPREIEQEYLEHNTKAKIEWVKLPADKYRDEAQVSEEDLRKMFEAAKGKHQAPEKRSLELLLLEQEKLAQSIALSEADLRRVYEREQDRFRSSERVKIRHILFNTVGKSKEEEAAIRSKAEGVLKQIRGGADFAELARKHSEDPGSASKGGDLDWVTRGQMVPEFEKAAFSLKLKEISDLVKTQYGYHIVQPLEREDARLKPFAEVKDQLSTELNQQRASDLMQTAADRARAALRRNPNTQQVANELNMQYVPADNLAAGDPFPVIGASVELQNAVFSLPKGEVTDVMLAGNRLVVARVKDITPPRPATFEEARNVIRESMLTGKRIEVLDKRAQELLDKAKSMQWDLRKAAQSMGLEVKTSAEFTRAGAVEGLGAGSSVGDAFTKPVGSLIGPVPFPDGRVVAKILGRTEPPLAELGAQRETIRQELKAKKARERAVLFEESVRQQLMREGKVKVHDGVVKRFTANYRG